MNQLTLGLAGILADPPKTKLCWRVHIIKEVPEDQPEPTETRPLPGFMHPDPDEMS